MNKDEQDIAQSVRNGSYFKEALAWYQALYINPVAERAQFLIIGIIASLVGVCGVLAMLRLLPITARPPILLPSSAVYQEIPRITPLRERQEPLNVAMRRFFLVSYVSARESYIAGEFPRAYAFVGAHSDQSVAQEYLVAISRDNPQSALRQVGDTGKRQIEVQSLVLNEKIDPPIATVTYTQYDTVGEQNTQTLWQAEIVYNYTPLNVKEVVDKDSGETIIETEEPQFQVIKYARQQVVQTTK